jgi:pyruvate dehydrogenase E1 component
MIPIYIFYSMFGFQRTGDQFWLAMDQMARGFVIGATAGRTTLTGEGLQHDDGQSMVLATTNPAVVAYDPAFGFEIAHIVQDGLKRMYGENPENIYYYMTVYNEPITQPDEPINLDVKSLLKGAYLYSKAEGKSRFERFAILASGVSVPWALEAQNLLKEKYSVLCDVYSVTSWNELRRDGLECERFNLLNPFTEPKKPFISKLLENHRGPVVAVSDWMKSIPEQIRPYLSVEYHTLGTDGYGVSDTRGALRRHFLIDKESIIFTCLKILNSKGLFSEKELKKEFQFYKIDKPQDVEHVNTDDDL